MDLTVSARVVAEDSNKRRIGARRHLRATEMSSAGPPLIDEMLAGDVTSASLKLAEVQEVSSACEHLCS